MSLDSSKKVLRLVGILTMFGGILAILGGALANFAGWSTSVPDVQQGEILITGGIIEMISGAINTFEGYASYAAGKRGKLTGFALIFATLAFVGSVLSILSMFLKGEKDMLNIVSNVLAAVLNLIVFTAANKVRKAAR